MSKKSSANTGGPLSMGLPEPLKTRPEIKLNYIYLIQATLYFN